MPTSDSEDFESADEGHSHELKKERKHRHSSSNYSDNALESEGDAKTSPSSLNKEQPKAKLEQSDGWDDFDLEDSEPVAQGKEEKATKSTSEENKKSQDTGWDDFDDWGDENTTENSVKTQPQKADTSQASPTSGVTGSATTPSGWGWGWGVDSLLSTATAGITTLTNQVSQGITTVLETGIGAPDPEELARRSKDQAKESEVSAKTPEQKPEVSETKDAADPFAFGSLLKFVGDTGSKVITGGLDTLETIGRKTMEVLQDGDPGLAKKRALLGLDPDKPVLSQVLREAKAKAEEEDMIREEKREAKEVHYERLFDDFEGLVHLEALEMLSKQVNMRIEEQIKAASAERRQDMKETLQQVAELCELPEEDEAESLSEAEEEEGEDPTVGSALLRRLQTATRDLGVKMHFQPLIKQYEEVLSWLSSAESGSVKAVNKRAISSLAQATALSVELYHKAGEMLLVKTRRSTADEADGLMQMTVVLTKHTSELANLFTGKLQAITAEDPSLSNTYITNIFLEAGNSATYIQNAFLLTQPIIQIGAI